MKKIIIIVLITAISGIVIYGVCNISYKRTPEKILKQQFNFSLRDFDYTIEFEEQWLPNGDGHLLLIINFKNLTQENINYIKNYNFQSLPVSDSELKQIGYNKIPKQFLNSDTGYYLYQPGRIKDMEKIIGIKNEMALDFKIFIIDIKREIAVLYYQSI